MDKKVSNAIAIIITFVWASSFIADILIVEYSPSPFVHMIMMGLAGAIFGQGFIKTVGEGKIMPPTPPHPQPEPDDDVTPLPREPTEEEVQEAAREWIRKSIEEGDR